MFSKAEAQALKKEFWVNFGKAFPRKWILYNTKIRDFDLKFFADNKKAEVILELGMKDADVRELFSQLILEHRETLENQLGEEVCIDLQHYTETGKIISKFWVQIEGVSVFNKNTWREMYEFFVAKMEAMESFFLMIEKEALELNRLRHL